MMKFTLAPPIATCEYYAGKKSMVYIINSKMSLPETLQIYLSTILPLQGATSLNFSFST